MSVKNKIKIVQSLGIIMVGISESLQGKNPEDIIKSLKQISNQPLGIKPKEENKRQLQLTNGSRTESAGPVDYETYRKQNHQTYEICVSEQSEADRILQDFVKYCEKK